MPVTQFNLSIVIQGPTIVNNENVMLSALKSAKEIFPYAEVICSTWKGMECPDFEKYSNHVVYTQDPGGFKDTQGYLNVNRQIVSSFAGVKKVSRKYTLKMRSDLAIKNENIIKLYNDAILDNDIQTECETPILLTNLTSVNVDRGKQLFSLCDWVYLGTTNKVYKLFSLPKFPAKYFRENIKGAKAQRFNAEQWFILNYLDEKYGVFSWFTDGYIFGRGKAEIVKKIYSREFFMISFLKLGMRSKKYKLTFFELSKMYTQKEWDSQTNGRKFVFDFERVLYQLISSSTIRAYAKKIISFVQ